MTRLHLLPAALSALFVACSAGATGSSPPAPPDSAAAALAATPDAFHYDRPLQAPRALRLYGLNGGVEASPGDDGQVHVRAAVRGEHPESIRIVARDEPRGVVVCVLFADEPPDDCRFDGVSRSGERSGRGHDARVDLVARVPAGVSLGASTVNGPIRALSLAGDVHASTVNGNIDVATSGLASAETVNGNVTIQLRREVDAQLDASTVAGEIRANFPMRIDALPFGAGPKSGRATLGRGGPRITLSTVNGNIDVTRGS